MGRKTANIRELGQALKAPAFGGRGTNTEAERPLEPLSPTTLVLHLDELKSYEHNPRHAENPEFGRLKDSIAMRRGLTTPLTVTRRPGATHHIVAAGGNSRLRALSELYAETGDEAFNRVTCQFEPWESDCRVLASHLIENEVRGHITFADKARAVVQWCEFYEAAHPDQAPLTQRQLVERLSEAGFEISQTSLNRLLGAAEHLLPQLPQAFESGLGREAADRLLRLRRLAEQYWCDVMGSGQLKPTTSFETVFAEVCAEQDNHCENFAYELFESTLAHRIAEALQVNPKIVTLDLDGLLRGIPVEPGPFAEGSDDDGGEKGWVFERERQHLKAQTERRQQRADARAQRRSRGSAASSVGEPQDSTDERTGSDGVGIDGPGAMAHWRQHVRTSARQLAGHFGLESLVTDCEVGCGYFIEPPEPPASRAAGDGAPPDAEAAGALSGIATWTWWWLAACAEQLDPAHLGVIGRSHREAWLVQLFQWGPTHLPGTAPRAALDALVPPPDPASLGQAFLASQALSDEAFQALQDLLIACRRLHDAARDANLTLWD